MTDEAAHDRRHEDPQVSAEHPTVNKRTTVTPPP